MPDKSEVVKRDNGRMIHVPPKQELIGQPNKYTTTLLQINAARRRNALKQVQDLIREHRFSLDEIEGK